MDVTCGGLFGIAIGSFTGRLFNRYFELANNTNTKLPA
jgi:hypothetical protein